LAEIEYRARSVDGKVRHPFFKGPAEDDAALLLADIPLRDTKLFRSMCVKSGVWTAKITRPTRSKLALGAFVFPDTQERKTDMSVKGEIKEGAGFVKEEMNEHGKSPESQRKAQAGRDLRNEGRGEDGKAPKATKPGTGHPEK
jgi:hypothetical protein